jgi:hypothetical protein
MILACLGFNTVATSKTLIGYALLAKEISEKNVFIINY